MSNNISTFSKPGTFPKILQALMSQEINLKFQRSFVTTKATWYLYYSLFPLHSHSTRGRRSRGLASSGLAPTAGQTAVVVPPLLSGDTPKYNKEYIIIQQSKKFHVSEAAKFFVLVCKKWCFFNSVWNNLINWLTRQHLATSREIF